MNLVVQLPTSSEGFAFLVGFQYHSCYKEECEYSQHGKKSIFLFLGIINVGIMW